MRFGAGGSVRWGWVSVRGRCAGAERGVRGFAPCGAGGAAVGDPCAGLGGAAMGGPLSGSGAAVGPVRLAGGVAIGTPVWFGGLQWGLSAGRGGCSGVPVRFGAGAARGDPSADGGVLCVPGSRRGSRGESPCNGGPLQSGGALCSSGEPCNFGGPGAVGGSRCGSAGPCNERSRCGSGGPGAVRGGRCGSGSRCAGLCTVQWGGPCALGGPRRFGAPAVSGVRAPARRRLRSAARPRAGGPGGPRCTAPGSALPAARVPCPPRGVRPAAWPSGVAPPDPHLGAMPRFGGVAAPGASRGGCPLHPRPSGGPIRVPVGWRSRGVLPCHLPGLPLCGAPPFSAEPCVTLPTPPGPPCSPQVPSGGAHRVPIPGGSGGERGHILPRVDARGGSVRAPTPPSDAGGGFGGPGVLTGAWSRRAPGRRGHSPGAPAGADGHAPLRAPPAPAGHHGPPERHR